MLVAVDEHDEPSPISPREEDVEAVMLLMPMLMLCAESTTSKPTSCPEAVRGYTSAPV